MTATKAAQEVRKFLDDRKLKYDKIEVLTVDPTDLTHANSIIVTVQGWKSTPAADEVKAFGRSIGCTVTFVIEK